MNTEKPGKAKIILFCVGGIDDGFLEEAETADIALGAAARRRLVRYSALGLAASFGIALACWLLRPRAAAKAEAAAS